MAAHIPGAISMPLADLGKRLRRAEETPRHRRVLPRSVLRDGARCGGSPATQGLPRAPHGARRARMASAGMARRERATTVTSANDHEPINVAANGRRRASWAAREPRSVRAARRRECLCRRHGRPGAQHPAGHGGAGVPARRAHSRALVHRGVRRGEGAHQLQRRPTVGPSGPQARARGRMAGRRPGALPPDVGAELELGAVRECPARHQPGSDLVDDRHHEDRPRGSEAARAGDGLERVRRIRGGGRQCAGHGLDRRTRTASAPSRSISAWHSPPWDSLLSASARPRNAPSRVARIRPSSGLPRPTVSPRLARCSGAPRCSIATCRA